VSDCVIDASALVLALGGKSEAAAQLRARLASGRRHAPHLIDAGVGDVLRRHERAGRLRPEEAAQGLRAAAVLVDHRYPQVGPLGRLAWTLRHNLTFYDALYVALATSLDLPLVTADARLSGAPGLPCTIELV
jgi:predicted nucleic acid-binding protein